MKTEHLAQSDAKTPPPTPSRIQLRRTKGWRMPANTIKVDRSTKWGNPHQPNAQLPTMADCVAQFARDMESIAKSGGSMVTNAKRGWAIKVDDIKRELRGHNLACWCNPGQPCHVDVLLKIANS